MVKFQQGDEVCYIGETSRILHKGDVLSVLTYSPESHRRPARVYIAGRYRDGSAPARGIDACKLKLVRTAAQVRAAATEQTEAAPRDLNHANARKTDPSTSKQAAKPLRIGLRQLVLDAIKAHGGANGHEIEAVVARPLNSITPRLAELRKAGLIKDSGTRRAGQIVWVAV